MRIHQRWKVAYDFFKNKIKNINLKLQPNFFDNHHLLQPWLPSSLMTTTTHHLCRSFVVVVIIPCFQFAPFLTFFVLVSPPSLPTTTTRARHHRVCPQHFLVQSPIFPNSHFSFFFFLFILSPHSTYVSFLFLVSFFDIVTHLHLCMEYFP